MTSKENVSNMIANAESALTNAMLQPPCGSCGSRSGTRRYLCAQCQTDNFCSDCLNFCAVKYTEVPILTRQEKVDALRKEAKETAAAVKKKSVALLNIFKGKVLGRRTTAANGDTTNQSGQDLGQEEEERAAAGEATPQPPTVSPVPASEEREMQTEYRVASVCRLCFRGSVRGLDLRATEELVEADDGAIPAATVVILHSGGTSRAMFRRLAQHLAGLRIRSVLLDLPGHGGRMDEPLRLESALRVIQDVVTRLNVPATGEDAQALLLLGCSLSGYVAIEYVGRNPTTFDGTIIVSAGHGVGEADASRLSAAAMTAATFAATILTAQTFVTATLKELKDPAMVRSDVNRNLVDPGLYFHNADAQLRLLKSVKTQEALARNFRPVLFVDGSKAFHDMIDTYANIAIENELKAVQGDEEEEEKEDKVNTRESDVVSECDDHPSFHVILSRSIQYAGASHTFTHQTAFAEEFYADVALFAQQVIDRRAAVASSPLVRARQSQFVKTREVATVAAAAAASSAVVSPQGGRQPTDGSSRSVGSEVTFVPVRSDDEAESPTTTTTTAAAAAAPVASPPAVEEQPQVAAETLADAAIEAQQDEPVVEKEQPAAPIEEETPEEEVVVVVADTQATSPATAAPEEAAEVKEERGADENEAGEDGGNEEPDTEEGDHHAAANNNSNQAGGKKGKGKKGKGRK